MIGCRDWGWPNVVDDDDQVVVVGRKELGKTLRRER